MIMYEQVYNVFIINLMVMSMTIIILSSSCNIKYNTLGDKIFSLGRHLCCLVHCLKNDFYTAL